MSGQREDAVTTPGADSSAAKAAADKPHIQAAPITPDPVEIAMQAEAQDTAPDSPARRLLLEQIELIRDDRRHRRWQIASERTGYALKVLTILAGLVVATTLLLWIWTASRAGGLVISEFSVPPDLEQTGLTGRVVAARLRDRLNALDSETVSSRAPETYADRWSGEIELEIPRTGVSIGELDRALRGWLGRETQVTGEVVRTSTGLSLAARAGAGPAATAEGSDTAVDQLVDQAAEVLYGQTQPYRYGVWLHRRGRSTEAAGVFRRVVETGPDRERAWGYGGLSSVALFMQGQGAAYRFQKQAIRMDPDNEWVWQNLVVMEINHGLWEAALASDRKLRQVASVTKGAQIAPAEREDWLGRMASHEAFLTGDFARALAVTHSSGSRTAVTGDQMNIALYLTGLHEPRAGLQALQRRTNAQHLLAGTLVAGLKAEAAVAALLERQDWAGAVARTEVARPALTPWVGAAELSARRLDAPAAYALARLGRAAEARTMIARSPLDCYPCLRWRARVETALNDRIAADRWFAEAVRQGPSLPFAYSEWGEAKAAQGDLDGAIAMFREAHARGPRWADPLKYWGDALTQQGEHRAAIRKYRAAAERAPRWGALQIAWGEALLRRGDADVARARFRAAAGMDLSAADRTALNRLQPGAMP